jgi:FKBP-type peptidyl-prolyl cis-trans isomerase FklB
MMSFNQGGISMKQMLTAVFCVFLLLAVCSAGEKPELTSQKDKESYSIGFQVGNSMKTDAIEVSLDRLIESLKDAMEGQKPRLSQEEMNKLIVDLKKMAREAQLKKAQEQGEKNLKEGEAFLEGNKKKEGVKITESGLQYRIIKDGDGPTPKATDTVTVHYRGTFADGKEFYSSYQRNKPEKFEVNKVIKGWTEALQLMKVGSKWQIFVPPGLAYGQGGQGSQIPPNSVLIFEIDLISIESEGSPAGTKAPQPSGTK